MTTDDHLAHDPWAIEAGLLTPPARPASA